MKLVAHFACICWCHNPHCAAAWILELLPTTCCAGSLLAPSAVLHHLVHAWQRQSAELQELFQHKHSADHKNVLMIRTADTVGFVAKRSSAVCCVRAQMCVVYGPRSVLQRDMSRWNSKEGTYSRVSKGCLGQTEGLDCRSVPP